MQLKLEKEVAERKASTFQSELAIAKMKDNALNRQLLKRKKIMEEDRKAMGRTTESRNACVMDYREIPEASG